MQQTKTKPLTVNMYRFQRNRERRPPPLDVNNGLSSMEPQKSSRPKAKAQSQRKPVKSKSRTTNWKFGTVNIGTGRQDLVLMEKLRECDRAGLSIVCMQEVKRRGIGDTEVDLGGSRWSIYWHGMVAKGEQGVAIGVKSMSATFHRGSLRSTSN